MDGSYSLIDDGATASPDQLAGLFARLDPLLHGGPVAVRDIDEMRAMARVYDLDHEAEPEAVWARLREVLTKSNPSPEVVSEIRMLTLLVVEDDPDSAQSLVDGLTEAGHAVIGPVATAEAAAVLAAQHSIDVALLDINLDGPGTGVDLAGDLKRRWDVPSVFMSGDVTQAARHAGLAAHILAKPYRVADVLRVVQLAAR
ncbi:MAG: response regulator [Brevundimonas sp.]|uniref:response regulator n=1 Tax=Brevundimonas sp. TaxID=1871086 RepID=UPI00391B6D43